VRITDIRIVSLVIIAAIFVVMSFLPRSQQFHEDPSRGFFTPVEAPADKSHPGCSLSRWDIGIQIPIRCETTATSLYNGNILGLRASYGRKGCVWIRLDNDALFVAPYEGQRQTLLPDKLVIFGIVRNKFYQHSSSPPPLPSLLKADNSGFCSI
jgi:hypothetical protein